MNLKRMGRYFLFLYYLNIEFNVKLYFSLYLNNLIYYVYILYKFLIYRK